MNDTAHSNAPGDQDGATPELVEIDVEQCLRLLEETPVGRLGFITEIGNPMILPVNHIIDDGDVAFRTAVGTKLDVAERLAGNTVVYEVDNYNIERETGWSVLVKGTIAPAVDAVRIAHLDRIGHHVWSDDPERDRWLLVVPEEITGRRIIRPG
jgi:nitroimidazol reductase NimA-like FMN-containing flavoprotein (pyridoxamine 5'-phosphate oxidase superfamily)